MLKLMTMTIMSLVLGCHKAITGKQPAPMQSKQPLERSSQESHQVEYNHQEIGLKSRSIRSGIVLTTSTKVTTQQAHSSDCSPKTAMSAQVQVKVITDKAIDTADYSPLGNADQSMGEDLL